MGWDLDTSWHQRTDCQCRDQPPRPNTHTLELGPGTQFLRIDTQTTCNKKEQKRSSLWGDRGKESTCHCSFVEVEKQASLAVSSRNTKWKLLLLICALCASLYPPGLTSTLYPAQSSGLRFLARISKASWSSAVCKGRYPQVGLRTLLRADRGPLRKLTSSMTPQLGPTPAVPHPVGKDTFLLLTWIFFFYHLLLFFLACRGCFMLVYGRNQQDIVK